MDVSFDISRLVIDLSLIVNIAGGIVLGWVAICLLQGLFRFTVEAVMEDEERRRHREIMKKQ